MMDIVAQYVSEGNVLKTSLLALVEVFRAYEGENLAPYILRVIEEWIFASNLGYLVIDNTSNNNTMMRYYIWVGDSLCFIYRVLIWADLFAKHGIQYDPKQRRLRC